MTCIRVVYSRDAHSWVASFLGVEIAGQYSLDDAQERVRHALAYAYDLGTLEELDRVASWELTKRLADLGVALDEDEALSAHNRKLRRAAEIATAKEKQAIAHARECRERLARSLRADRWMSHDAAHISGVPSGEIEQWERAEREEAERLRRIEERRAMRRNPKLEPAMPPQQPPRRTGAWPPRYLGKAPRTAIGRECGLTVVHYRKLTECAEELEPLRQAVRALRAGEELPRAEEAEAATTRAAR